MGAMLEEGLEAGAYGFSNGLEYALESAASEDETAELCRIVARAGALYATHERNKDIHAAEAIEEGIRVARASEARLQVSHIVPRRGSPPGSIERVVELVEDARSSGLDAAFDAHTRLHGILNASAALPSWALEGTPDDLRARLRDTAGAGANEGSTGASSPTCRSSAGTGSTCSRAGRAPRPSAVASRSLPREAETPSTRCSTSSSPRPRTPTAPSSSPTPTRRSGCARHSGTRSAPRSPTQPRSAPTAPWPTPCSWARTRGRLGSTGASCARRATSQSRRPCTSSPPPRPPASA